MMYFKTPVTLSPLKEHNALLGDRAALDAAFERDGYWFFRDVLDKGALARMRESWLRILKEHDVVEPGDPEFKFTGRGLETLPKRMEPLVDESPWKSFVKEPAIHDFIAEMLGDEPFWLPIAEYRANPPDGERDANRFAFVHQDAFYNEGIPMRICWVPLADIDEDVGGLALAEAMHQEGPYLHDLNNPPLFFVPDGVVPADRWRRSDYRLGDLLIMHCRTPHSGLTNVSDRVRMSLDIRLVGRSDKVPSVGPIVEIGEGFVTIRDERGENCRLVIDSTTYVRGITGNRLLDDEIMDAFKIGDDVIAMEEGGVASVLRKAH